MQRTASKMQHATCERDMRHAACNIQFETCNRQQATCNRHQTRCNGKQTACIIQHAISNTHHITDTMQDTIQRATSSAVQKEMLEVLTGFETANKYKIKNQYGQVLALRVPCSLSRCCRCQKRCAHRVADESSLQQAAGVLRNGAGCACMPRVAPFIVAGHHVCGGELGLLRAAAARPVASVHPRHGPAERRQGASRKLPSPPETSEHSGNFCPEPADEATMSTLNRMSDL